MLSIGGSAAGSLGVYATFTDSSNYAKGWGGSAAAHAGSITYGVASAGTGIGTLTSIKFDIDASTVASLANSGLTATIKGPTVDTTSLALGSNALRTQAGAGPYYNTATGVNALLSNTTGAFNTATGLGALFYNTTGAANTATGVDALVNNTTGASNTATGFNALFDQGAAQTAGAFSVGISYTILTVGTTDFTLIGAASNTVGVVFTATGVGAGTGTATPNTNNNTAYGYNTGRGIAYGSNNTIIGANVTGLAAGLSDAIILATGEGTIRADFGKTAAGWTFAGAITVPGTTTPLLTTSAAITTGAGSSAGTLTNAPSIGNPTKSIPISDNGTTRYIPAW